MTQQTQQVPDVPDVQTDEPNAVELAERYYDSNDADQFYHNVWGGEDIHIGLYNPERTDIREASHATVQKLADSLASLSDASRVLDLGAGYGGAARYLAKRYGCSVTCLNLSETQNARNREKNREQRLAERVTVQHGNFEAIPFPDKSFSIVWSQDAILHSANRPKVLQEVRRVLKPGGEFIFTDPMQADDCPSGVLEPVLARIHLDSLGSFRFYAEQARQLGFNVKQTVDLTENLIAHYSRVRAELQSRYEEIVKLASQEYVDRMLAGLGHWVDAGTRGYLSWGILHFEAI